MKFHKNNFLKGVMITDFIFLGLRNHYELNLLGNIEIVKVPISKVCTWDISRTHLPITYTYILQQFLLSFTMLSPFKIGIQGTSILLGSRKNS